MRGERLGGGAAVLPNLDDDAMGVARMQEGLLPVRIGQVDPEVVRAYLGMNQLISGGADDAGR